MQITLDLEELSHILSDYWGFEVPAENMQFQTDPVRLQIQAAPLRTLLRAATPPSAAPAKPAARAARPAQEAPPQEAPHDDNYDEMVGDEDRQDDLSLEDLVQLSKAAATNKEILQHPEVVRALSRFESQMAPPITQEELYGRNR